MDPPGRISTVFPSTTPNIRTYYVVFCFLVQLQMLIDLPTPVPLSEVDLPLPSSEEEWSADRTTTTIPPTPGFKQTFTALFSGVIENKHRYSEFGGYVMISGILSSILNAY